jgi:hypothetical protein
VSFPSAGGLTDLPLTIGRPEAESRGLIVLVRIGPYTNRSAELGIPDLGETKRCPRAESARSVNSQCRLGQISPISRVNVRFWPKADIAAARIEVRS